MNEKPNHYVEEKDRALEILKEGHVVAFTGAGISTASGIPDYRGPNGLWRTFDPKDFTIEVFQKDPARYWNLRMERKRAGFDILNAKPNKAHYALAELEEMEVVREVITQNADGLHQKAGSSRVIELHGNASFCVCTSCGKKYPSLEAEEQFEKSSVPKCIKCNLVLKPDVVFFGEKLDPMNLELASEAAVNCKSVLVIGTTASVYPASIVPRLAKRTGAKIIEVNAERTELNLDNLVDVTLIGDCTIILPDLVQGLRV